MYMFYLANKKKKHKKTESGHPDFSAKTTGHRKDSSADKD